MVKMCSKCKNDFNMNFWVNFLRLSSGIHFEMAHWSNQTLQSIVKIISNFKSLMVEESYFITSTLFWRRWIDRGVCFLVRRNLLKQADYNVKEDIENICGYFIVV